MNNKKILKEIREDARRCINTISTMYGEPELALYIFASEIILMSRSHFNNPEAAIGHVLEGLGDGIYISYTNRDPLLEDENLNDLSLKDVSETFPH